MPSASGDVAQHNVGISRPIHLPLPAALLPMLLGLALIPVAYVVGVLAMSMLFPLALIALIDFFPWAWAVVAFSTTVILPAIIILSEHGCIPRDKTAFVSGLAGLLITQAFVALSFLRTTPEHSAAPTDGSHAAGAYMLGAYLLVSFGFGGFCAGYVSAKLHLHITNWRRSRRRRPPPVKKRPTPAAFLIAVAVRVLRSLRASGWRSLGMFIRNTAFIIAGLVATALLLIRLQRN